MIHLAGRDSAEKIDGALKEIEIYWEGWIDGAIIGSYFKKCDTNAPVSREHVRKLVELLREY